MTEEEKSEAARLLGKLGGSKGGKARAEKLTKEQRVEIARKAAKARWDKKRREESSQ
jgi:ABC-type phosphate/phosphonate transport system ATPase subunit